MVGAPAAASGIGVVRHISFLGMSMLPIRRAGRLHFFLLGAGGDDHGGAAAARPDLPKKWGRKKFYLFL
jgi:hypothetical protein